MDTERLEHNFFITLLVIAFVLSFFVLEPYLSAIVLSGTLAFLFAPLYQKLFEILKNKNIAAFLVVIAAILIIFIPLLFFGLQLFNEAGNLYTSFTSNGIFYLNNVFAYFPQLNLQDAQIQEVESNLLALASQGLGWIIQNLGTLSSGVAQAFLTTFLTLLGLFYFLKDGGSLKTWVVDITPLPTEYTLKIIDEVETAGNSVIKGTLAVAVLQGIIMGIGFLLFNIPNGTFWGALTILTSLLPVIGTWLVAIPAIVYLFVTGQTTLGIGLTIWSVILLNLIYNIVTPQLVRRRVDIHPFIVLLSVLGGIAFWGPMGFLIGPSIIAFLFSLLTIYPKLILKRGR